MPDRKVGNQDQATLSRREVQVAELFADGKTYKLIARDLGIAPATVRRHLNSIYEKLGVRNKIELSRQLQRVVDVTPSAGTPALADGDTATGRELVPDPSEDRRSVTVLAAELRGLLAYGETLDPEELGGRLAGYRQVVDEVVTRFDGHTSGLIDRSVRVYFGFPQAHEDDAERALHCGLALIAAIADRSLAAGAPLRLAAGVATGEIVVSRDAACTGPPEAAIVGTAPHLAAHLRDAAADGSLLAAAGTTSLVGHAFALTRHRACDTLAHVVRAERSAPSRFDARSGATLAPVVGRGPELAWLRDHWRRAQAGDGQSVLLIGEAGIGKSRLIRALIESLDGEPHRRVLLQCSPYHQDSALWPIKRHLQRAAGLAPADDGPTMRRKLTELLAEWGDDLPVLLRLLDVDEPDAVDSARLPARARRSRTLDVVLRLLLDLAHRQPLLLILEDLHWIDPTTLELVETVLDRSATRPMLLLLTARPSGALDLPSHRHLERLTVDRLDRGSIERLVRGVAGERLSAAAVGVVAERSDGVPLHAEELTKTVVETGEAAIPAGLRASFMARLDRLASAREPAQIAACIGREFDHRLLADLVDLPRPATEAALDRLVEAEIIFRSGNAPDARYWFKHALLRDAAYDSLPRQRRRDIHARIATALRRRRAGAAVVPAELIAWHLTEAGRLDKAIPFWLEAGRSALAALALSEARAQLTTALELSGRLSAGARRERLELDARIALAGVHFAAKGWPATEVREVLEPAVALSERLDDVKSRMFADWYICLHHFVRCETGEVLARISAMNDTAGRQDDPSFKVAALCQAACSHVFAGRFDEARGFAVQLDAVYDFDRDAKLALVLNREPMCWTLNWMAFAFMAQGHFSAAAAAVDTQQEIARRLDLPYNTIWALTGGSDALSFMGAIDRHLERIERARAMAVEHAADFALTAICPCHEGIARVLLGDFENGYRILTAGTEVWNASGGSAQNPMLHTLRAHALLNLGRAEEAIRLLREVIRFVETTGHKTWWPEHHRALGNALLAAFGADLPAAQSSHETAIVVARRMNAKTYELRATRDLARLLAERGERQRASDLLSPIYGWFTEGFETPDLIEAKALLGQL